MYIVSEIIPVTYSYKQKYLKSHNSVNYALKGATCHSPEGADHNRFLSECKGLVSLCGMQIIQKP